MFKILVISFTFFLVNNVFAWNEKSPSDLNIDSKKIEHLFDLAFSDDATQSVVLIKDGFLIGERYANGYDKESFGTSWSVAKSFYAALILISIDKGEIQSLDERIGNYINFNDERDEITIRQLLNMSSGLQYPWHQHEAMFFKVDHMEYAKKIELEKQPDTLFEYNNINSMLLGEILISATGKKADILLEERILDKIGIANKTLWRDAADNVLTYCCIDMSARDYAKFGQLFANDGTFNGEQIISKELIDETFQYVWDTPSTWTTSTRGYSLHWWVSRYEENSKIFNASGRFGQYIFVDNDNDVVFVRITKYQPSFGSKQNWGGLSWIGNINNVGFLIWLYQGLESTGLVSFGNADDDISTPNTRSDGESDQFYDDYHLILDAIQDLSQ
ncbi:beta-lactamase family protein [Pseudomonadota bacterium]|nr:beta-lactamase family protein [Pseudomonadota bacterium]